MSRLAGRTPTGPRSPGEALAALPAPESTRPDPEPPRVTGISPMDAAVDVPTDAVIVITFSRPMDTASVEAALSVTKITSQRG